MTAKAAAQSFNAEDRQNYIGCSEIAALLGLDKWKTALDVYNTKLGLVPPFEGNNHTMRGQRLEHIAAELFTEITGRKLRRMTRDLVHPAHDFIRGHIDRLVEGEKIVAEIKCVSVASYRKLQREGLPENYIIQLNTYLGLGGYSQGLFIIFCPDQFDLISFPVDFNDHLYSVSINAAYEFWTKHVQTETPPSFDTAQADVEIAKQGGSVTVRDDETFIAKVSALKEAADLKRDADELHEIAKKDVIDAIEGEPGCYQVPGLARIHYTQTAGRVTFDKKALAAAFPQIDLKQFEKQGKSFNTLRTYFEA
jgi:putative phage-type endonuclease